MLPSMRHYLRFIDLEAEYDKKQFRHKVFPSALPTILHLNIVEISLVPHSNSFMAKENAVSMLNVFPPRKSSLMS